jgi:serine/threonine protein kinase
MNWSFDPSIDSQSVFRQVLQIGSGGFGVIWKILHIPSNKVLAGKLINPSLVGIKSRKAIEAEIELMRDVDSLYTVKYFGSAKYDGSIMVLMEYCRRGSLRDVLDSREQPLTEDQISIVIQDLLKGLQLLQTRHRIIHRDVKASNILLSDESGIKITDFGVSRRFTGSGTTTMTIVGTPYWMAPEVISGLSYSFPADIWSVGITAVELAEGAPPYVELPPARAMVEIAVQGFPGYRYPDQHSPDFADFVRHCVEYDPNRRWTIAKLLGHPFVRRANRLPRADLLAEMLPTVARHHRASAGAVLEVAEPPNSPEGFRPQLSDGALPVNRQGGANLNSLMLPHRPKVGEPGFGRAVRTIGKTPFANWPNQEQDIATVYHPPVGLDDAPVATAVPGRLGVVNTIEEVRVAPIVVTVALVVVLGACGVEWFVGAAVVVALAWLLFAQLRHVDDGQHGGT